MTIWLPTLSGGPTPKYKQLADAIEQAISDQALKAHEKLPPQRLLADALKVTVGTITRAYNEAERRGSVVARVGSGTFVKVSQPQHFLSQQVDAQYYDLRSANAPVGLQLEMLSTSLAELASERLTLMSCLSYQPEIALAHQREQLAQWLTGRGIDCAESNVLFTYGGQHGISLALQVLCRAGDTVLCEGLAFPGISVACQQQQLRCIGLEMDEFGITPAALTAAITQCHPRVLYLTPQLQNPTAAQMPLARKQQLVAICQRAGITILEDDVQFLPAQDKNTSFYQLAPEQTIYIASFSKCFSGGLRIGYLVASQVRIAQLRVSLRASCWTLPPLMIEMVCRWLHNGKMAELEHWLMEEMAARTVILLAVMQDISPTPTLKYHPHGFNVWLTLPEPWRAVDFVNIAEQQGVLVRAAESYAVGRFPAPQNIRLSICAPKSREQLREALLIIKQCLLCAHAVGDLVI